jgi:hypothetical protein
MTSISVKKNIPLTFGAVKQTVNIPIAIAILANTANAPIAVAVRCLDQHEYSLNENIVYIIMIEKKKGRCTKVLESLEIASLY